MANEDGVDILVEEDNESKPVAAYNGAEGVDILVVEDNKSERESIVEALKNKIRNVRVVAVSDGEQAFDFLVGRGDWADRDGQEIPRLIVLDLAMPGTDGFSLLGQIRSIEPQDALTLVPVVVFTNSPASEDIGKSYRCGANSYVIKPLSYADFQKVVETVAQYWMKLNKPST